MKILSFVLDPPANFYSFEGFGWTTELVLLQAPEKGNN